MQNRTLYFGDNLEVLREKIPDDSFDLIYLDPPFNSNRSYNVIFKEGTIDSSAQTHAFEDSWHWELSTGKILDHLIREENENISNLMQALEKMIGHNDVLAYLTMMTIRLIELRRVLKSTGSIYLHCDPTASHYLKIVMDAIFGKHNFQNEIVWHYRRWTGSANKFLAMHDILLFYTKQPTKYTFNPLYTQYTTKSLARKQHYHTRIKGDDKYVTSINEQGVKENDVWDIPVINSQAKERLGYPTQKPEALLERIIKASSNENDWVLDPFCGCGTTLAAAEKLNRNWVGIDISTLAINVINDRLSKEFQSKSLIQKIRIDGLPKDVNGARLLFQKNPWDFEYWAIFLVKFARPSKNKTSENMKGPDRGVDGIITFLKDIKKSEYGKIIIQVKGGHVQRNQIATLKGDIEREKADGGLFISLEVPTSPMKEEAIESGCFKVDYAPGKEFQKIQILTIKDLLNGRQPDLPYGMVENHFKEAQPIEDQGNQKFLIL